MKQWIVVGVWSGLQTFAKSTFLVEMRTVNDCYCYWWWSKSCQGPEKINTTGDERLANATIYIYIYITCPSWHFKPYFLQSGIRGGYPYKNSNDILFSALPKSPVSSIRRHVAAVRWNALIVPLVSFPEPVNISDNAGQLSGVSYRYEWITVDAVGFWAMIQ